MNLTDATFVFKGYQRDFSRGRVDFYYAIKRGGKTLEFAETLKFKKPDKEFKATTAELTARVLNCLFLILGISYWKTCCPRTIEILPFSLSKKEAEFWNTVYTNGLGEFFYKNNIDFHGLVKFPYSKIAAPRSIRIKRSKRSFLLFGGGKDSLVAAEILKKKKKDFSLFMVGESAVQKETASLVGKPSIAFMRVLDPKLLALNGKPGVYNGHVPASAIYAFAGVLAGVFYGFNEVIASNEKSANYGNVRYRGTMINHQWSKSQEFETLLSGYLCDFLTPNMRYYSLLRPLTELEIVKEFMHYPKYFNHFSSCNKNFRIANRAETKWCGECPKCAFVFTALAAYLPKVKVVKIFGKNLFADEKLVPLYKELLGLEKFKPFECVGTPEETKKAFRVIYKKHEYSETPVMKMFESA